jgi:malate dehydrogenase (oxaloacetate-decarboxylating)
MMRENQIMRIVRCRNVQIPGTLGKLLVAIGDEGGDVGTLKLVHETARTSIRDITIYANDELQMANIIRVMDHNPGTQVIAVRDEVLELHQEGKIAIRSRYEIDSLSTLRRVYTPGVAEVCLRIAENPDLALQYTAKSHLVAIVTDGTAILGLGDIGPLAGMPVMEGKAMLLETLCGLSGVPILLDTKNVDEIVATVANIAPTFAAIQLEDISAPRCFEIEHRLQDRLDIPVMHDDQHGTAVVTIAALEGACRYIGRDLCQMVIGQIGLGAAGFATSAMLMNYTGKPVLGTDISQDALSRLGNAGGTASTLEEIMTQADIVVATTGVPGLIKPEMIREGQVILALSNPVPEILPELALEAGAAFAADGKSVNNVLGFPGILRGAVDARARYISQEMYLVAALTIAELADLNELVPNPLDKRVHQAVAKSVAMKAMEQGIAQADYVSYTED